MHYGSNPVGGNLLLLDKRMLIKKRMCVDLGHLPRWYRRWILCRTLKCEKIGCNSYTSRTLLLQSDYEDFEIPLLKN